MKDMYDRLFLKVERCEGEYGVEIEVEGSDLPERDLFPSLDKLWRIEEDGSLRGEESAEFVLRKPTTLEGVKEALGVLDAAYEMMESDVDESIRAGVHVHMNIQRYTPLELLTFITTFYVMEDLVVHWCGKGRVGNHFCLRCFDAEFVIHKLIEACEKRDWRFLNTDEIRYAALNLTSMFKYGSVEFRSMRSTRDLDAVYKFVRLIDQVAKGAKKFANPKDVVHSLSEMGGQERFIKYVMEDMAEEFSHLPNVSIMRGMRTVQPLVQKIDWEKFNKEKVNPFL